MGMERRRGEEQGENWREEEKRGRIGPSLSHGTRMKFFLLGSFATSETNTRRRVRGEEIVGEVAREEDDRKQEEISRGCKITSRGRERTIP